MSIIVCCPHCNNTLQFHDSFADQLVSCHTCLGQLQLPDRGDLTSNVSSSSNPLAGLSLVQNRPALRPSLPIPKKIKPLPALLIGGALAVSAFAVCCGGLASSRNESDGRGHPPTIPASDRNSIGLTADYFPHKPGAVAVQYVDLNGSVMKYRHSYEDGGVWLSQLESVGAWENGDYKLAKYLRLPSEEHRRRISGRFIEHGEEDENGSMQYHPEIMVGATVGEGWRSEGPGGLVSEYRLLELKSKRLAYDGKSRPVAIISMELKQDGETLLYKESEYMKGIGFVRAEAFVVTDGKRKLTSRIWLEELTQDMNLTKGERAFFK